MLPGLYESIPNEVYHNDKEWLSSSQIKVALGSAHAFKYFVLDGKGKKETTKSLSFGSVVHKLVLENDDFHNEYFVADADGIDMRTKVGKEMHAALTIEAGTRTMVTRSDYDNAIKCYDSVMGHKDAARLLNLPGLSEASIYVELPHTLPSGEEVQFKVRVRPDRLAHGNAIIDLKTTKNASKDSFTKDALSPWGYHYDVSAALYVRAVAKLTGEVLPFTFIAVRNDQPWECGVYNLGPDSMHVGAVRLDKALNTIILSERAGLWSFQDEAEEI